MDQNISIQLQHYLNSTKNQGLEKKPNQFSNNECNRIKVDKNIEFIKKQNSLKITKQIKIICNNIIKSFLGLNDQKFLLCLQKIHEWNFEMCMKQFIMSYYLYIKNDNRLRNYIVLHLDLIINILKDQLEKDLIKNMQLFNFENSKDTQQVKSLKNQLKNKLDVMVGIQSSAFNEEEPIGQKQIQRLDVSDKNNLRVEITNRLRKENPSLQELL